MFEITQQSKGLYSTTRMRVSYNNAATQFSTDLKIQAASAGLHDPDFRGLIINVENDGNGFGKGSAVLWLHEDALPEFFRQCLAALDNYEKYKREDEF